MESTVKITAQDEKECQAVANLVDALLEVRYESVEFEHSDKITLRATAKTSATSAFQVGDPNLVVAVPCWNDERR